MILLIANSRDFATDYVVAELRRRSVPYLRLDTDLFSKDAVSLDPEKRILSIARESVSHELNASQVEAVLYRAPTHLSESGQRRHSPEEELMRHQWAAFVRSLVVFDHALWVNHPQNTYLAENKPYQLAVAANLGFRVPATTVTNVSPPEQHPIWTASSDRCAIKALDTFLIRDGETDLFFYTQDISSNELKNSSLHQMPLICQSYLSPKIDIRVTVVGDDCFPVEILSKGTGIEGDWRTKKRDEIEFHPVALPEPINALCITLVRHMGLVFGAIDLARVFDEYYFLEINPTGEWAWLIDAAHLPIDKVIADTLCGRNRYANETRF